MELNGRADWVFPGYTGPLSWQTDRNALVVAPAPGGGGSGRLAIIDIPTGKRAFDQFVTEDTWRGGLLVVSPWDDVPEGVRHVRLTAPVGVEARDNGWIDQQLAELEVKAPNFMDRIRAAGIVFERISGMITNHPKMAPYRGQVAGGRETQIYDSLPGVYITEFRTVLLRSDAKPDRTTTTAHLAAHEAAHGFLIHAATPEELAAYNAILERLPPDPDPYLADRAERGPEEFARWVAGLPVDPQIDQFWRNV